MLKEMEIELANLYNSEIKCGTDIDSQDAISVPANSTHMIPTIQEVLFLKLPFTSPILEDGKELKQNAQFIEIKNNDDWTHLIFFGNALPPEFRASGDNKFDNETKNITVGADEFPIDDEK